MEKNLQDERTSRLLLKKRKGTGLKAGRKHRGRGKASGPRGLARRA